MKLIEGVMQVVRYEEICPASATFIPTPVLSGSGSMGVFSVCYIQTPLKDFGRKDSVFVCNFKNFPLQVQGKRI